MSLEFLNCQHVPNHRLNGWEYSIDTNTIVIFNVQEVKKLLFSPKKKIILSKASFLAHCLDIVAVPPMPK